MIQHIHVIHGFSDKEIQMEHACTRQVGQQHADCNGQKQQGLKLFTNGKVDQNKRDQQHDNGLPAAPVKCPRPVCKCEQNVILCYLEKQLPDTRACQKI